MQNNKGQALVEFIIILPLLILVVTGIVDMGNIFYKKYQLENDLDFVANLYQNKEMDSINNYIKENNLKVSYKDQQKGTQINLSKSVVIITPGLKKALNSPYNVTVKRVVYHE